MSKKTRGRPKKQYAHLSREDAQKIHDSKPSRARKLDESKTSKYLVQDIRFKKNSNKVDYPGVDTKEVGKRRKTNDASRRIEKNTQRLINLRNKLKFAKTEKQKDVLRAKLERAKKRIINDQRKTI
ncbi:MAG: hypothetical protein GYA14_07430 [Ignavibacteria bacterium]|nr:hypothetical protein [Ignavibacteria bacterium]